MVSAACCVTLIYSDPLRGIVTAHTMKGGCWCPLTPPAQVDIPYVDELHI